uniref:Uncharacterized protein n=1 Tax=Arundo donax TaxID=35708 RepID=A0A0A9D071_ARUDO
MVTQCKPANKTTIDTPTLGILGCVGCFVGLCMMNGIKRFSELQVDVRFHEVHCNKSFVHSIPRFHRRDGAMPRKRKDDMCVFCKLKGPKCISCLVYTGHSTLMNLVTAN